MKNKDMEARVSRALDGLVRPDAFDRITAGLAPVDREKSAAPRMHATARAWRRFIVAVAAVWAVLLVGFGAGSYYRNHLTVDTVIDIDVNPGIELKVSKADIVLAADAVNADGAAVLEGMELEKTALTDAVTAVVNAAAEKGYVQNGTSSVLVTVQNTDSEKADRIRGQVVADIDTILAEHALDVEVISQTLTDFNEVTDFAHAYEISYGKAAFVLAILDKDPLQDPDVLAEHPVYTLTAIAYDVGLDVYDMVAGDTAQGDWDIWDTIAADLEVQVEQMSRQLGVTLITPQQAREIALTGFPFTAEDVAFIVFELVDQEGLPVYEIEFYSPDNGIYEYGISALDGSIVETRAERSRREERENTSPPVTVYSTLPGGGTTSTTKRTKPSTTTAPEDLNSLTQEQAAAIALYDRGEQADEATDMHVVWYTENDGTPVYMVSFTIDDVHYIYRIHANTGDVLTMEKESLATESFSDSSTDSPTLPSALLSPPSEVVE